jgi:hypothetical protein
MLTWEVRAHRYLDAPWVNLIVGIIYGTVDLIILRVPHAQIFVLKLKHRLLLQDRHPSGSDGGAVVDGGKIRVESFAQA